MDILRAASTDFIVRQDDFGSLEIRDGGLGNGFYYFFDTRQNTLIKRFVLGVSKTGIKICCAVTFIEKGGKYTPRLELSKRSPDGTLANEKADLSDTKISSRIDLRECHENFWSLIEYIQSIREVEVPRGGLVAVTKDDKVFLDQIRLNRDFVQKVLTTFSTEEAQGLLVQAKKDDVRNLHAAVKQAKNKQSLVEIERIISSAHSENDLQSWIDENNWVFGIEYIRKIDLRTIGIGASADFVVESLDGYADVIELKKAHIGRLFTHDTSHDTYYASAELAKALSQATNYIKVMEDHRHLIKDKYDAKVLKPRAKIVIGRSNTMNDKEKEALRVLNDSLHGVEVITYDEIVRRARTIVSVYDE